MTRIAIVVGSTRPGRRAEGVARWVHGAATARPDCVFEVVDIADYNLPLLDEPAPPAMGRPYAHEHTRRWAATIASFDGFVFVTPEYNHSTSAALKNAIDYLYEEWKDKAAGFVSYGVDANGARAVEHLRGVTGELSLAAVRTSVALSLIDDFSDVGKVTPRPHQTARLDTMVEELIRWSRALRPARPSAPGADEPEATATAVNQRDAAVHNWH